ncbi:hypothetical protein FM106_22180 [Brachybacterium faecium]|nr:hypothetical protein FM106_22180 [Brachybacterium faecium]
MGEYSSEGATRCHESYAPAAGRDRTMVLVARPRRWAAGAHVLRGRESALCHTGRGTLPLRTGWGNLPAS